MVFTPRSPARGEPGTGAVLELARWRLLHEKINAVSVLTTQNIFPRPLFPDDFAYVLCQNQAIVGTSSIYPSVLSFAIYSILGFSHKLLHGVRRRVGVLFLRLALLNVS